MIFPSLVVYLWEAEKAFHPSSGARHWAVCYHSISCQMEETELWTQKNIFRCLCSPKQMLNLCMLTVTSYLCTDRTGMETYPKRYWASEKKHQQPLRVGLAAKKKKWGIRSQKKKSRPHPCLSARDYSDKSELRKALHAPHNTGCTFAVQVANKLAEKKHSWEVHQLKLHWCHITMTMKSWRDHDM